MSVVDGTKLYFLSGPYKLFDTNPAIRGRVELMNVGLYDLTLKN